MTIAGIILAGGQARRMGGGDKPLMTVAGHSLLDRIIARLAPQVGPLLLNVNGEPSRFAAYGLPLRADVIPGYGGPLVGILTGLDWAQGLGLEWLVSAAADTPLLPADLVTRLRDAVNDEAADMAMAMSGGRSHPVFALWPVRLAGELRRAIVEDDTRKVQAFTDRFKIARVDWPQTPHDPFFNVNTHEDLRNLEQILAL